MLGTLVAALEVRGIDIQNRVQATAKGFLELEKKIPVLNRIHIHYEISIPADAREKADRALATHRDKCPTAKSFEGKIAVEWDANIIET
jgi:organic hydroperoxide reductase OsmC/OhrA